MINAKKITVDEFRVERLNMGQKKLDVSFTYSMEGASSKISRTIPFGENVVNTVIQVMNEMKKGKQAEIEKEEEMRDKLVSYMQRLFKEISDMTSMREQDKYMKSFNRINCYKVNFPEVEIQVRRR